MFEHQGSVLLSLSQDVLDRARVVAGKATAALKLPVSLQIVLRALIGEGLKGADRPSAPTLRARPRRLASNGARRGAPGGWWGTRGISGLELRGS